MKGGDPLDETVDPLDETVDPLDETVDPLDEASNPFNETDDPFNETSDPFNEASDPFNEKSLKEDTPRDDVDAAPSERGKVTMGNASLLPNGVERRFRASSQTGGRASSRQGWTEGGSAHHRRVR